MKKIIFFFSVNFHLVLNCPSQTFPSQNISLLGRWSDSTVVAEPQHGIKYNGVFGWANPLDNREYAIIGSTAGTYFIEVTNPDQPVFRDFLPGRRDACIWREIHAYKNFCYIVSDDPMPNSFQIVNLLSLPDSVQIVHDSTTIMSRCHTIFVDGNKLYGGIPKGPFGQSSLAVFSLNDPANPLLLRRLEQDYTGMDGTHDMFVRNDTIYASMSNSGYFVFRFDTVLNKFNLLGSMTSYPFKGYNHSSSVSENGEVAVMCDEVPSGLQVKVVNVKDISDISVSATCQSNEGATPHNPYIIGNDRAVISYYQDGVQIYDISDPANPVRSGYFDTRPEIGDNNGYPGDPYQGCWGAFTRLPSGNILASDMQNGLFVLNASIALNTKDVKKTDAKVNIFPNPTTGKFEIRGSGEEMLILELYTILGVKILSVDKIREGFYDISSQPDGVYILKNSGNYFSGIRKFMKIK